MARRKKTEESVSVDEVREEMESAPLECESEAPAAVATGEAESVAPEEATPEGETAEEEAATEDVSAVSEEISDPGDATKIVSDSMQLRVRLTDAELVEYGDTMIEALDEAKIARSRLKGYQAECKEQEEKALQRFEEAKQLVRSKHEERMVPCEQIHNFTRGKVYTRRLDTGELVQTRNMNPWERQSDIEEVTSGQAEPEAEEATEAQADSDDTDEIEIEYEDGDQDEAGELAGVATGDDEEGEI